MGGLLKILFGTRGFKMRAVAIRLIFYCGFFLAFGACGLSQQKQMVPDRQLEIFTNEYGRCAVLPILEGPTVQSAFSNLEPNLCIVISNTAALIASNIASTLDDAVLATASNSFYLDTNPSNFITSAGASNDFYPNSNPSNFLTAADVPASTPGQSLVCGMVPVFVSGSSVSITPGSLVARGTNFLSMSSAFNLSVSSVLSGVSSRDIIYYYIDTSSFLGGTDSFFAAVTEPVDSGEGVGKYHPVTTEDRYIGSSRVNTNGSALLASSEIGECGSYTYSLTGLNTLPEGVEPEVQMWDLSSVSANLWINPDVVGSFVNDMVPVFVTRVLVGWHTQDNGGAGAGNFQSVSVGSVATGASDGGPVTNGAYVTVKRDTVMDHSSGFDWVPLIADKSTRDVFISWSSSAANDIFRGVIASWEVSR